MLFRAPNLGGSELMVLEAIDDIRQKVKYVTATPRRWSGMLRRNVLAEALLGSNSIEGIRATFEDAVAVIQNEEPVDTNAEVRSELIGYRHAMTYVLQLAYDPSFHYQEGFIRGLHFMMLQHDLSKNPGKWRPGSIFVRDEAKKVTVYEAPPRESVEPLMAELVDELNDKGNSAHRAVRAAMAHLNLVMIHPFSDGNGRMARCLQTLVFARHGILEPEFCSVEEYCGKQQRGYYEVLAEVGKGAWNPQNDTRPWIHFMLKAHFVQAYRVLWVNNQLENLWGEAEMLCRAHGLPERTIQPVVDGMLGVKVRNSAHRSLAGISENLASRDLKALVDAKLLVPKGQKRGRHYEGSDALRQIAVRTLQKFRVPDPFAPKEDQPKLPGF